MNKAVYLSSPLNWENIENDVNSTEPTDYLYELTCPSCKRKEALSVRKDLGCFSCTHCWDIGCLHEMMALLLKKDSRQKIRNHRRAETRKQTGLNCKTHNFKPVPYETPHGHWHSDPEERLAEQREILRLNGRLGMHAWLKERGIRERTSIRFQ